MNIEDIEFYNIDQEIKDRLFEYIVEMTKTGGKSLKYTIISVILTDLWEEARISGCKLTKRRIKKWIDVVDEKQIGRSMEEWLNTYEEYTGNYDDDFIDDDTYRDEDR